ncbi:MAG: hypothetical protein WAN43_16955 [Rhodomicrobium sp.]
MGTMLRGLLLGLLATLTIPCLGAEVGCFQHGKSHCLEGYIKGEIIKGDYLRVKTLLRDNHPFLSAFLLQSPGGDAEEAIRIGHLFRNYYIRSIAPRRLDTFSDFHLESFHKIVCNGSDCVCASACALIWFGAPYRSGDVGLHRPSTTDASFRELSPTVAEKIYKPILTKIAAYLEEMEVPKKYIEAMIATSSADIYWTNIEDENFLEYSPSFYEWLQANCGQYGGSAQESKQIIEIRVKQHFLQLSQSEEQLLQMLDQRQKQRVDCEEDFIGNFRARLERPKVGMRLSDFLEIYGEKPKDSSRLVEPTENQ